MTISPRNPPKSFMLKRQDSGICGVPSLPSEALLLGLVTLFWNPVSFNGSPTFSPKTVLEGSLKIQAPGPCSQSF